MQSSENSTIATANHYPPGGGTMQIEPAEEAIVDAEMVMDDAPDAPIAWRPRSWPVRLWHGVWWLGQGVFGWASLMVGLAVLATIPLVNFVSLGYLLECSGRIARTGRLRDGFADLDRWARLGSLFIGTYLSLVPLRFISDFAYSAYVIAPGSRAAGGWRLALIVTTLFTLAHILLAWYCGGKLRHFFWPLLAPFSLAHSLISGKIIRPIARPILNSLWPSLSEDLFQPEPLVNWFPPAMLWSGLRRGVVAMYVEARDAVWDFVVSMRLPYHFQLGLRGFLGALLWLFLPIVLLIGFFKLPNDGAAGVVGFFGFIMLATVLLYLPFIQTRFAAENRFRAFFELGAVRRLFRQAPLLFWVSLVTALVASLPLFLFKVQPTFEEIAWLPSLFFVLFMYPVRLMTGWAVGLAARREKPRNFVFRWLSRLAIVPIVLLYVLFVGLSQYTSWNGAWSLFEQHLFLIPAPFFSQ